MDWVSAPRDAGVGLVFPERDSDCSGVRPAWFSFQVQVDACDGDAADPVPLTPREMRIPGVEYPEVER